MKKTFVIVVFLVLAGLTGCTTTQQSAAVGGVGGAAVGGIIGHQSGHGVEGAAIGAGAGAIGGMVVGQNMEKKFCPKCGKVYTADTKYCPVDGTELKYRQ